MTDLSNIDTWDLLERCDVKNMHSSSGGIEINFSCPYPGHSHGDENPSAYMNVESKLFLCHTCKRRGNALTFYIETQEVSRATALKFMRDTYGVDFDEPVGGSMVAETETRFRPVMQLPEPTKPSESWMASTRLDWDLDIDDCDAAQCYMLGRGFRSDVMAEWEISYDYQSDRVTIPVRDVDGVLVGLKGRSYKPDQPPPRYKILGDTAGMTRYGFAPYESSEVVFGLHRERGCRVGVLCEGELNAIALAQIGVTRPIATGMSYCSDRHAQLMVRELDEVVVFYDLGDAGYKGTWGYTSSSGKFIPGVAQVLEPYIRVKVVTSTLQDPAELLELGLGQRAIDAIERAESSLDASAASIGLRS